MPRVDVDGLTFDFPDGWNATKYDDWSFYRKHITRVEGIKALDLLAMDPERTVWLIEVKDYRRNARTNPSDLSDDVALKVYHTMAALLPASLNASSDADKQFARAVVRARKLRVVLHLEQPAKHSKLFPRAINPDNVQLRLRQLLKPVDAHPLVLETNRMMGMRWSVA